MPFAINCPLNQTGLDTVVTATDVGSGASTTTTFSGNYFCLNVVVGTNFNGGCP
jgi:hypothetical protein